MSESRAIDAVKARLVLLSKTHGIQFMLITKDQTASHYQYTYSNPFCESQASEIDKMLSGSNVTLDTIRPTLKHQITIDLSNFVQVKSQYFLLLTCISQNICKDIAKLWIKTLEPKKQTMYPYKHGNSSKPPWWPEKVNHVEPDHLDKRSRIELLIGILETEWCNLEDLYSKTATMKFKNPVTERLLHEIYYLARYHRVLVKIPYSEKYNNASTNPKLTVSNLRGVHGRIIMSSQIGMDQVNNRCFAAEGAIMPDGNSGTCHLLSPTLHESYEERNTNETSQAPTTISPKALQLR